MAPPTARHPGQLIAITALGVPIDIEVRGDGSDDMARAIRRSWSGAARTERAAERTITVWVGDGEPSADLSSRDPEFVLHHLSQLVTQVAIEARAGELMMFHAAGLAHPATGRTVALVAPSGTGKTTICRRLGRNWAYVTDETVGVAADLSVASYRKPLSVVRPATGFKAQTAPADAGLMTPPASLTLTAVVLLQRDDAMGPAEVDSIRTVAALPLLAEQTSYLGRHRRPLRALADILEATGGLRMARYRASEDLQPLIARLIGGTS